MNLELQGSSFLYSEVNSYLNSDNSSYENRQNYKEPANTIFRQVSACKRFIILHYNL